MGWENLSEQKPKVKRVFLFVEEQKAKYHMICDVSPVQNDAYDVLQKSYNSGSPLIHIGSFGRWFNAYLMTYNMHSILSAMALGLNLYHKKSSIWSFCNQFTFSSEFWTIVFVDAMQHY